MKRPKRKAMAVLVTPLQRVVGFHVSEKTYDLLELNEQVLIDLLIEGYKNIDIACVLGVDVNAITRMMQRIRLKLADSELRFHLEMKAYYKESTVPVLDPAEVSADDYQFQSLLGGKRHEDSNNY